MGLDLATFMAVGLQNAVAPLQLALAGVLVLALAFLARASRLALVLFTVTYIVAAMVSGVVFDLGVMFPVFASYTFGMVAGWSYFCLGVVFILLGGLFFKEWRMIQAGSDRPLAAFVWRPQVWPVLIPPCAVLLAVWLVFLGNVWPTSMQVIWQGATALTPGKLFYSLGALMVYELCRNALSWLVLIFLAVFSLRGGQTYTQRRRSLLSAVLSAYYLAVGGGLIHFFIMKLSKG
jgi:hypothetical protein